MTRRFQIGDMPPRVTRATFSRILKEGVQKRKRKNEKTRGHSTNTGNQISTKSIA